MTKAIDMKASMKAGIGSLKQTNQQGLFGQPMKPVEPDQFPVVETLEAPAETQPRAGASVAEVTRAVESLKSVAVPMTDQEKDAIDMIARKVSRNPLKKPERITANTVVRCLIDMVLDFNGDLNTVQTSDDLYRALLTHIKGLA